MAKHLLLAVGLPLLLVMLLIGCSSPDPTSIRAAAPAAESSDPPTATTEPGNTLVLAYDGWTGSYLSMYVLKTIFESNLGYNVRISDQKTIPAAFESVATGQADIFTSAWFPARDSTLDKYPNLVKLGQVYGGKARDAYEGWMVPVELSEEHGSIMEVFASINNQKSLSSPEIGADVRAKIGCGKRSLGYVLFGDVIEFCQRRFWFLP